MDAPDLCGSCRRWALGLRRDFSWELERGFLRHLSIYQGHSRKDPKSNLYRGRRPCHLEPFEPTFKISLDLERLRAKKRGFEEQNDIGIRTTGETDVALQTTSAKVRPTAPADDYSYYSKEGEEEEERSQDNPVDIPVLPTPRQPSSASISSRAAPKQHRFPFDEIRKEEKEDRGRTEEEGLVEEQDSAEESVQG